MRKLFLSSLLLIIINVLTHAQTGIIKGTIIDSETKESLIGATVVIKGTLMGSTSDFDGNYTLTKIPVGKDTVVISFISYDPQEFVVDVKENEETILNVELSPATLEIEGVEVVAKANRESENMLLIEQKNSVISTQAIGAQEISRKGASDAEAAVTKVSGISKQEGEKNVFVRGLGDRFNTTTLNGFPVPSEDPEYKNISLDFFSSEIIKAIEVKKVFSAGIPGDVAGAVIDISSKELIGSGEFGIDLSAKANTRSITTDFLIPDGVSNLGFGENTKSPASEDIYAFKNSLDPVSQSFQMGKGFGISGGKRFEINRNPLTFYVLGSFDNDFSYTDGITRETTTDGTIFRDQNTKKYERKSSQLAMANVNYSSDKNILSYNLLVIHTANETLRDDFGQNSEVFQEAVDRKGLVRRQQNNLNTLVTNQFDFKREISNRITANIGAAYNYTLGKEPDRRVNYLSYEGSETLSPLRGSGRQHRYFSTLNENDINVLAKVTYKFSEEADNISSIELGYKGRFLSDEFHSNSWDNSRTQSTLPKLNLNDFSLDSIFSQDEFEARHFKNDEYNVSSYTVDKKIHSAYVELNYQLTEAFILNFGLKADLVSIKVNYNVNDGANKGDNSLNEFYFLPALNLKYSLNEKNALRLGASRTYTLPQSKEISPLLYEGPQWSSQGNPDLVPSANYNLDLKWEFYPSSGELISFAAFEKIINVPISRVEVNSSGGFLSYANIADGAQLAGVEAEIKKNIFSGYNEDSNMTNKLSVGLNFSYVTTGVKTDGENAGKSSSLPLNFTNKKTKLEGATPIIFNGDLSYNYQKNEFEVTASLVANYKSRHIYSIGVNGYNDIEESEFTTVDFVSSVKLNKHFAIKLKAKNLLDPEYQLTRKPSIDGAEAVVLRSYKKGIGLNFGLSYQF